jgi:hypothetical protein
VDDHLPTDRRDARRCDVPSGQEELQAVERQDRSRWYPATPLDRIARSASYVACSGTRKIGMESIPMETGQHLDMASTQCVVLPCRSCPEQIEPP